MEWSGYSLILLWVCVFVFFLLCVVAIAWCHHKVVANQIKEFNCLTMEIIKYSTSSVVVNMSNDTNTDLRSGLHPYPYLRFHLFPDFLTTSLSSLHVISTDSTPQFTRSNRTSLLPGDPLPLRANVINERPLIIFLTHQLHHT